MNNDNTETNRRILVVDDNEAIHADFRKILIGERSTAAIDEDEAELFGAPETSSAVEPFEIDSAYQGREALAMVRTATHEARPYAVAFVDVRMPPGWDGVETIGHLWPVDPDLQIVICTAYSDYSWDDMIEKLGMSDRLLILKKPFDNVEVCQLATALTEKWRLAKMARLKMDELEHMVADRTRELANSEARSRAIVNTAADGIITCEGDGRIESFNHAAEGIFGYAGEEIIGRRFDELTAPSKRFSVAEELATHRQDDDATGVSSRRELQGQRKDRSLFPMELAATEVRLDDRRLFTLLIRDVSERKKAEELDRRRQIELAQAVRLGTISEMVARVAEELDQPLSAIANFAQGSAYVIRSSVKDPAELLDAMNDIIAQAERAANILQRVRDVSHGKEPHFEAVDLNEIIRRLTESMETDARSYAASVKLELDEKLPQVRADASGVEQVLLNLIRNALESSDQNAPGQNELFIQTSITGTDSAVIAVHDAGVGVPADIIPRLFDPFFTTKPNGVGMGLSISRSIVAAHGGRLWATPNREFGMTFRFTLPLLCPGNTGGTHDNADLRNQEHPVS